MCEFIKSEIPVMSYFCHLVVISSKYIYVIKVMFEVSEGTFLYTYMWNQMYCCEQKISTGHDNKRIIPFISVHSYFKQGSE